MRQAESAADRGVVDGTDHGLLHVAQRQHHVVEHLERAQGDRGRRELIMAGQPVVIVG
jgi:hypothetical protein